jgi:hypothetical protein
MLEQFFESFRKASESTLQTQQDIFLQWVQQWPSMPIDTAGVSAAQWSESLRKRWVESSTAALNQHRELLDASYRVTIHLIEQAFRVSEAKSLEEYRRLSEELLRTMAETFKQQSETQLREIESTAEKWLEMGQPARANGQS